MAGICDVGWCVSLRATDADGREKSIYCAVHMKTPEAFKAKDPDTAKREMGAHNRKLAREKERAERPQPLPAKK